MEDCTAPNIHREKSHEIVVIFLFYLGWVIRTSAWIRVLNERTFINLGDNIIPKLTRLYRMPCSIWILRTRCKIHADPSDSLAITLIFSHSGCECQISSTWWVPQLKLTLPVNVFKVRCYKRMYVIQPEYQPDTQWYIHLLFFTAIREWTMWIPNIMFTFRVVLPTPSTKLWHKVSII